LAPGALVEVDAEEKVARLSNGAAVPYDVLLVACGASPVPAVRGALTFRGSADTERIRQLLRSLVFGDVQRVVFVVPWGAVWPLPAYELALMTATLVTRRRLADVELALLTPEDEPLHLLGAAASAAVRALLAEHGVSLHVGTSGVEVVDGELRLLPDGAASFDRVVALPRLRGPRIDGLPQTVDGFIPVDAHGRVRGLADVFAAADVTRLPRQAGRHRGAAGRRRGGRDRRRSRGRLDAGAVSGPSCTGCF
jgi:sulfide:quinone oxidoreductase